MMRSSSSTKRMRVRGAASLAVAEAGEGAAALRACAFCASDGRGWAPADAGAPAAVGPAGPAATGGFIGSLIGVGAGLGAPGCAGADGPAAVGGTIGSSGR